MCNVFFSSGLCFFFVGVELGEVKIFLVFLNLSNGK
jgi:hypothetical protein